MTALHSSLDRFTLQVTPKVNPGLSLVMNVDLNALSEELVDRLSDQDLIDFVAGIVELYADLDTTEGIIGRLSDIRAALEQEALEAEDLLDRHGT